MRNIIFILVLTILSSAFVSCADNTTQISSTGSVDNAKDTTQVSTTDSVDNTSYITAYRDFYQNGLIYQPISKKTMFLDFDTMKSVTMCSVPNCNHTISSCLGMQLEPTPIMYNNYAYSFNANTQAIENPDGVELSINSSLQKVSLSNSEFKTVCKFTDCTPRIREGYLLCDNLLYFIGYDENPHKDDYGNISWLSVGGEDYLCCINLDNGDYKNYGLICYVEDQYPTADTSGSAKILGCYENKIYIGYSFLASEDDDDWQLLSYEFDLDNKTIQESDLPYAAFINDDFYVYCDKETNITTILNHDKSYTIPDCRVDIYAPVYNGKMFTYHGFYDLATLSEHTFKTDDDLYYEVITYYNDCYILRYGDKFLKLTEDELLSL